ncbi:MAG: WYL domain-containing protein [Spongiibacteraceae bacterium]
MDVVTKHTRAQRLYVVELLSYWEGQINSTTLREIFGLSRQQASADINRYIDQRPRNLSYNSSAKSYQATSIFSPAQITGDVAEYLNWIQVGQLPQTQNPITVAHTALELPARKVSPQVMRGLIAAIRKHQRVEVDYVSLTNPNSEGRVIAPHTFVKTGLRWHLRAWCEKSQQYRDFVLSRFWFTAAQAA